MSAVLRGWFASRLSIGRASKCLLLKKVSELPNGKVLYDFVGARWFNMGDDKARIKLGKEADQFIYPEDIAFRQKNVDVYFKDVKDGRPVNFDAVGGVYPDPFSVHLWGAQRVAAQLLAGVSANLMWIVVGAVVGGSIVAAVLLGLIQTGVFTPVNVPVVTPAP